MSDKIKELTEKLQKTEAALKANLINLDLLKKDFEIDKPSLFNSSQKLSPTRFFFRPLTELSILPTQINDIIFSKAKENFYKKFQMIQEILFLKPDGIKIIPLKGINEYAKHKIYCDKETLDIDYCSCQLQFYILSTQIHFSSFKEFSFQFNNKEERISINSLLDLGLVSEIIITDKDNIDSLWYQSPGGVEL